MQDKLKLFWDNDGLNDIGVAVEKIILEMPKYYFGIWIDKYVIMPDHIHLIIKIDAKINIGRTQRSARTSNQCARTSNSLIVGADLCICPNDEYHSNGTKRYKLGDIVQRFKMYSTKIYIEGVKNFDWPRFRKRLWQRNYFERIIRNKSELNRIRKYIEDNPKRLTSFILFVFLQEFLEFVRVVY